LWNCLKPRFIRIVLRQKELYFCNNNGTKEAYKGGCRKTLNREQFMGIIGQWKYYYDWGNDGRYSQTTITFKPDETFTTGQGSNGKWNLLDDSIIFIYTNGTIYSGNVCGSVMVGSMNSRGVWYTIRETSTILPVVNTATMANGDK